MTTQRVKIYLNPDLFIKETKKTFHISECSLENVVEFVVTNNIIIGQYTNVTPEVINKINNFTTFAPYVDIEANKNNLPNAQIKLGFKKIPYFIIKPE
jgi:hypothetical protein